MIKNETLFLSGFFFVLFLLTDDHTEICGEIIFSAIKKWAFTPVQLEIILCKSVGE